MSRTTKSLWCRTTIKGFLLKATLASKTSFSRQNSWRSDNEPDALLPQDPDSADNSSAFLVLNIYCNFITEVQLTEPADCRCPICPYQSNQTWQLLRTSWQREKSQYLSSPHSGKVQMRENLHPPPTLIIIFLKMNIQCSIFCCFSSTLEMTSWRGTFENKPAPGPVDSSAPEQSWNQLSR